VFESRRGCLLSNIPFQQMGCLLYNSYNHFDTFFKNFRLLQERLALLETGEMLENCLDGLSEEEALLIKKAARLRSDPKPGLTAEQAAAQRRVLLQFAKELKMTGSRTPPQKKQSSWVWPLALAGGGIVTLAFVTIFAILAGLAVLRWRTVSQKIAQNPALETAGPSVGIKSLTPVPEKSNENAAPGSGSESFNPTPEASQVVAEPPDALSALLGETRGLVEFQGMSGAWEAVHICWYRHQPGTLDC
jgi:hypothetical protein